MHVLTEICMIWRCEKIVSSFVVKNYSGKGSNSIAYVKVPRGEALHHCILLILHCCIYWVKRGRRGKWENKVWHDFSITKILMAFDYDRRYALNEVLAQGESLMMFFAQVEQGAHGLLIQILQENRFWNVSYHFLICSLKMYITF